jgi:hypothetical protein
VGPVVESGNPAVFVDFDEVGIQWMIVGMKEERTVRRARHVLLPDSVQVDVGHDVAVDHGELIGQSIESGEDGARGA